MDATPSPAYVRPATCALYRVRVRCIGYACPATGSRAAVPGHVLAACRALWSRFTRGLRCTVRLAGCAAWSGRVAGAGGAGAGGRGNGGGRAGAAAGRHRRAGRHGCRCRAAPRRAAPGVAAVLHLWRVAAVRRLRLLGVGTGQARVCRVRGWRVARAWRVGMPCRAAPDGGRRQTSYTRAYTRAHTHTRRTQRAGWGCRLTHGQSRDAGATGPRIRDCCH
jgi:hypothetical protein